MHWCRSNSNRKDRMNVVLFRMNWCRSKTNENNFFLLSLYDYTFFLYNKEIERYIVTSSGNCRGGYHRQYYNAFPHGVNTFETIVSLKYYSTREIL